MVQRGLRPPGAEFGRAELALGRQHSLAEKGHIEFSTSGYKNPQCSACFINSVKDSLDSILTLAKTEGMLFKWGIGTGTNLSPLRGSTEAADRAAVRPGSAELYEGL